ncbi:MAG: family ATPase [Parcubacteria group bacterium]|nr:family ATPase [Parcubacteria group bacterium]
MIIGSTGAGKTVFTDRLGKALNRGVIHLDNLFWKEGWVRAFTAPQWDEKIRELISNDEWILDGNYHRTMSLVLDRADTVVFFDFPSLCSLFGAYKRKFFPPVISADTVPNLHQQAGLKQILKATFTYPRKDILRQINSDRRKCVYIVKNRKEAERAFKQILDIFQTDALPSIPGTAGSEQN